MSYRGVEPYPRDDYDGYKEWAGEDNMLANQHDAEASAAEENHNESMDFLIYLEDHGLTLEQCEAAVQTIERAWKRHKAARSLHQATCP